jgi:membrane fusion protein, multidrug efflux system
MLTTIPTFVDTPMRSLTSWARRTAPALLLTTAVAACGGAPSDDAPATAGPAEVLIGPENIAVVTTTELASGPVLSGRLQPVRAAAIRAEVAAAVLSTEVEPGTRVAAGTVLARLDDSAIRDAWLSARSGATAARTAADQAAREAARAERLLTAGAIAERDAEAARRGDLAAKAQLADAEARLAAAQKQLDATVVKAPFAGVVSERPVSAGDIVAPGTPLFTVIDPASMRLEASIPAAQLGEVRVGMPVRFRVSGYGDSTFTGRITAVNPTADGGTGQVRLYASLPNARGTLVAGLFAEGRVATDLREALSAPLAAVDQRGLRAFVVRLRGGQVERLDVTVGLRDEAAERVEVIGALAAGDTLLLGTAQGITTGSTVRVSAPTDTARAK